MQGWGPEFNPQQLCEKGGTVCTSCDLTDGEVETDGFPQLLASQPSWSSGSLGFSERLLSPFHPPKVELTGEDMGTHTDANITHTAPHTLPTFLWCILWAASGTLTLGSGTGCGQEHQILVAPPAPQPLAFLNALLPGQRHLSYLPLAGRMTNQEAGVICFCWFLFFFFPSCEWTRNTIRQERLSHAAGVVVGPTLLSVSAGVWTQGLACARQAFYRWAKLSATLSCHGVICQKL